MTRTDAPVVVAIDAGQSGMKVRIERPDTAPVEALFPGIRTHEALAPQLAAVAHAVADQQNTRIDVLSAGISGLTDGASEASELRRAFGSTRLSKVLLAHDSVTSYLGALGDHPGAVVAAGTGVVTLGVGRHRVARVDGWGNIMGDAGSGYWIGREALDAVMRAHDGRSTSTALTDVVRSRWPDLESAYIALQTADDRVYQIAALAEDVADLADADAVATSICRHAAAELALSASTALRRVAEPGDAAPAVAAIGGVFRSDFIHEAFERALRAAQPAVRFRAPQGAGVDGAAALAQLAEDHALLDHVSLA